MVKNHRDLTVWQRAVDLVMEVNRLITNLPRDEKYALADQLRRAALSIPSNIAEGRARSSDRDYLRFLLWQGVHWLKLIRNFILPLR